MEATEPKKKNKPKNQKIPEILDANRIYQTMTIIEGLIEAFRDIIDIPRRNSVVDADSWHILSFSFFLLSLATLRCRCSYNAYVSLQVSSSPCSSFFTYLTQSTDCVMAADEPTKLGKTR